MTGPRAAREQLEQVFRAALAAVDAEAAVARAVRLDGAQLAVADSPLRVGQKMWVLAAGKAAGAMAAAFERIAGEWIAGGLAVTTDASGISLQRVELRSAAHPVPDARSESAGRAALELVARAGRDDALVVLLSGGASSLLACPAPGLSLADVASVTALLLAAGADIAQLNAVRKHLSAVAGGRLGLATACLRIDVLAISDVPGDRLDVLGSGPFAGDASTWAEVCELVARLGVAGRIPERVRARLAAGARGEVAETPRPDAIELARVRTRLLATNATARDAAVAEAQRLGMRAIELGEVLHGEARTAGRRLAALARAAACAGAGDRPLCLVGGGETVVRVQGGGRGGRNQELALAAAEGFAGCAGFALLAAGTDGSDGPTPAAGAFVDGGSWERGRARGQAPAVALAQNDSHTFFEAEGGLLITGPTRTNVMDLVLLRIDPRE